MENTIGNDESAAGVARSRVSFNRLWGLAVLALVPVFLGACDTFDEILEVDLPGEVVEEDLNNPELAETLVRSAQADFECAFRGHLYGVEAGWAQQFHYHEFLIELIRLGARQDRANELGTGECTDNRQPVWFPMQLARTQASSAISRIEEMPADSVEDREFLLAKAHAYEGYATQQLGEAWCGVVFGGDEEIRPREDAFSRAEDRFTAALEHAEQAQSGARASDAEDIMNLALVGRARARLNLGDEAGALEDAERVTEGFVRYATFDESPPRRRNPVDLLEDNYIVHEDFRELEIDGVPDPRVPTEMIGEHRTGFPWWVQKKFTSPGDDIPFASWREAQLMIAEVEGGQRAVQIINQLRNTVEELPWVTGDHDLPEFSSTDEEEIMEQVLEERRRELFLHGTKIGDDLRTGHSDDWDTGTNPMGQPYGDNDCLPVPDVEFL